MIRTTSSHARAQHGLSLVELMVAMTLGLIIMGSALQAFTANKQSFRFSQALSRMQEDGRFAMQAIARDIRMAGYVGCSSRRQVAVNNVANGTPPAVDLANALFGYDDGDGWWTAGSPPQDHLGADLTICNTAGGGNATCQTSDIVQVVRASETATLVAADMATAGGAIAVRQADFPGFQPALAVNGSTPGTEDLVLVTDCRRADLFRVTALADATGLKQITPNAALQQTYQAGAIISPLVGATYFIADDNADEDGDGTADPVPALYRIGVSDGGVAPAALPVAKGVEMMRINYGVDTGGDEYADAYVDAAGVTDWSRVVSVRISLLIKSSEDRVTDAPVPVTFVDGTVVNSGANADRRLRLVFSTTVGLRNRVP
ncbi:MAG: PilW family protein [Gammaproteobacteria bacterium]|uniref:PilW family protein n=1 Tax=Oceanibaculum nanhaiense TaxID=1909734 RepID=UPI0032EC78F6